MRLLQATVLGYDPILHARLNVDTRIDRKEGSFAQYNTPP